MAAISKVWEQGKMWEITQMGGLDDYSYSEAYMSCIYTLQEKWETEYWVRREELGGSFKMSYGADHLSTATCVQTANLRIQNS